MKRNIYVLLTIVILCFSCNNKKQSVTSSISSDSILVDNSPNLSPGDSSNDVEHIQALIRGVLNWAEAPKTFDMYPLIADAEGEFYTGFNMAELDKNIEIFRSTGYFTEGFIKNYRSIILTLDKRIKNGEYGQLLVDEMPPFVMDVDPWTLCQDVPYDNPNPFDNVIVEVLKLDDKNGELVWKWGKLDLNNNPEWKELKYEFKVAKENGHWKISYLKGFDYNYNTSTK